MNVTRVIIHKNEDATKPKLLAMVSIVLDFDIQIDYIKLYNGQKGEYLVFPSNKFGKFITYPINEDSRQLILTAVLNEFYKNN